MQLEVLAAITIVGTVAAVLGYFLMRRKYTGQLEVSREHEEELAKSAYETQVLKEIGDRIGYSLDAGKIIEIISGSLGKLLPYSTVAHMIIDEKQEKVIFATYVAETVSPKFIKDVKTRMLAAFSEMRQEAVVDSDVDESISGAVLDEKQETGVESFFNLPIVISGKIVGLINVASTEVNLYNEKNTAVLYSIAKQASEAVSRLQEVLESEKGKLSQAVESLSDGLLMVDTKYQLVLVNKKLVSLMHSVAQPAIFDIVNALSGQLDLRTKMEEAIAKKQSLEPVEITTHDRVLQVVASPVFDKRRDKPMGVVVLFHDITDAKALEKLRSDFTSVMVHELRAPLTSIKSSVDVLKSGLGKDDVSNLQKYLSIIDSTSQTMLELVNDLLDVAKLEVGKFDVICENANIAEVIGERVESFGPVAADKNLKINLSIAPNLPEAYFDKIRTKQVLNNLLSNAIKYTETGEITVKVAEEEVSGAPIDILVSVADTGIGIEADKIDKLFLRFGQLESGRQMAGLKSSGLGLYIAKSIVDAMGGKIWVKSAGIGSGSTFFFTIPVAKLDDKKVESGTKPIAIVSKVAQA